MPCSSHRSPPGRQQARQQHEDVDGEHPPRHEGPASRPLPRRRGKPRCGHVPQTARGSKPPLVLTPTSASLPQPVKDMGPPSNKTEDQVRHLLLVSCPGSSAEPHDEAVGPFAASSAGWDWDFLGLLGLVMEAGLPPSPSPRPPPSVSPRLPSAAGGPEEDVPGAEGQPAGQPQEPEEDHDRRGLEGRCRSLSSCPSLAATTGGGAA